MELDLPTRGEPEPQLALVTKRIRDANGLPIGKVSDNPILDTRMYKVKYVDNEIFALSANLILEKKIAQINEEVNRHVLIDEIADHRFDEVTVNSQDAFVTTSYGTKHRRQTMQGVSMCIQWRDRNKIWVALKDIK